MFIPGLIVLLIDLDPLLALPDPPLIWALTAKQYLGLKSALQKIIILNTDMQENMWARLRDSRPGARNLANVFPCIVLRGCDL